MLVNLQLQGIQQANVLHFAYFLYIEKMRMKVRDGNSTEKEQVKCTLKEQYKR